MIILKKHSKSAASGPKTRSTVGLGSEFSVCKEAQMLIDALENCIDGATLAYVKECFEGFSGKTQSVMTEILLNSLIGRLYGCDEVALTGIHHVDDLILGLVHTLDEQMVNPCPYVR